MAGRIRVSMRVGVLSDVSIGNEMQQRPAGCSLFYLKISRLMTTSSHSAMR